MEAPGEPGASVVPEATLESSTWARRLRQFQAVTTRLRILKLRQKLSTFCDLALPIILIVPLVFAYSYYSPDIVHSRPFVNDTTATLVEAAGLLANASEKYAQCQDILDEHREKAGNASAADLGIQLPVNTSGLSDAELEQLQSCTDAQGQLLPEVARTLMSAIVDDGWHGPMPVLNLDEFLLARKAFTSGLSSSPVLQDLYDSASRVFGWNMMGNLVGSARLAVAPLTPEVTAFVQHMQREYILFNDTFLGGFSTVEEAEAYLGRSDKEALWALLVFHRGPNADGADYTIRMNYTSLPPTFVTVDRFGTGAHSNYKLYTTSGFLSLQAAVDAYVLSRFGRGEAAGDPASESLQSAAWPPSLPPLPDWLLQEDGAQNSSWMEWGGVMAVETYMLRDYYDIVGPILGLVVCIAFVYPLSMFTRAVVEEKETGLKDLMVIMGMDPVLLSLSWASVFYLQVALSAVFVMITLKASFLPMTSWSLLLVLLLLYLAAETALSLVVAAVFRRARLAAVVGALIHFAAILPRYIFFRTSQSQSLTGKWIASLLAPSALSFAFDDISAYERVGGGVSWSNFREGWFPFSAALLMLAVDTLLYTLLAWSLGHGDTVSAWLQAAWSSAADILAGRQAGQAYQRIGSAAEMQGGLPENAMELELQAGEDGDVGMTEASPFAAVQRAPPPVVVQALKKVFGRTTAVHHLDLQMHADCITALLGHNGAGKSTTISMITGMMKPSGGSVRILGHDMVRETAAARQHVGVCPQSDVLVAKLTVWEHLMLFSAVKGVAGGWGSEAAASHAEHLLVVLGLDRHRDSAAKALSGGLKRKLQLAIALLAGSKVVLLDEPSSGMDPLSRRGMWALLQRCKRGRAMLLTTHYMDEADVLSDHISIMSQGRVCAHGSSLQLKQQYGDGYTLTFALGPRSDPQRTVAFMQSQLGAAARFLRQCGGEVAFSLPTSQTTAFPGLLQELERRQAELGIEHFGLAMPTLEEAFLRATAQATPVADVTAPSAAPVEQQAPHSKQPAGSDLHQDVELAVLEDSSSLRQAAPSKPHLGAVDRRSVLSLTAATGAAAPPPPPPPFAALERRGERGSVLHAVRCLRAMLAKRWLVMSRDFRGVLFLYGVPLAAVALVMLVLTITIDPTAPSLVLDLHTFDDTPALMVAGSPVRASSWPADVQWPLPAPGRHNLPSGDRQFCLGSWPPPPGAPADGSRAGGARALRDDDYQDEDDDAAQHSGDNGQPFPPPDFPAAPSAGPAADPHCSWTPSGAGVEGGRGLRIRGAYNRTGNSSVVCAELLREQEAGWWPQRAALVLDDEVIRAIPEAVLDALLGTNATVPRAAVTASPEEPESSLEQERGTAAAEVLANAAKLIVAGNASLPVESLAPLLLLGGPLLTTAGALPLVGGSPLASDVLSGLPQGLPGLQALLDGGAAAPQLQQGQALALVAQRMALRFQASRPLLVLHNASSYHILPAALSGIRQAMAAAAVQEQGGGTEGQGPMLKVTVHPLPLEDSEALQIDSFLTVLAALFVLVPMMYLTGAFVIQHVDEVRSGAKQQQLHSGCPLPAYWLGHYLADAGIHAVLSLLILAVFAVYDDKATTETAGRMAVTYLVLLLFGAATIPFSYLMSFGFSSPSSAQLGVAVVNMALGVGLVLMSYLMRMLKDTRALHKQLVPYFRLLPPFNFGEALLNFSKFRFQRQLALAQAHAAASAAAAGTLAGKVAALSPPETHVPDIFEKRYLGRPVHNLLMEAALYFMLVLLLETVHRNNLLQRLSHHLLAQRPCMRCAPPSWQRLAARAFGCSNEPGTDAYAELAEEEEDLLEAGVALPNAEAPGGDEDRDVAAERSLVESGALDSAALCIRNLRKQFAGRPPKTAVQDLCLSVQAGERLGLLGGNGAGKTTTLSVVSGALLPSGGRVAVAGCDVVDAPASAKQRLGYCPQYSPLVPHLTAEEHLRIYATLRAVPAARQRQVVAWTLQQVGLPAEMARRPAGEYSGGSKRKLSLAIALLGEPSCVLLDEPGCGLDPASRRTVWDIIATSLQPKAGGDTAGAAMVLTTHSMEECEALCSRVGILHAGRLLCLGSIQHLKSRFGAGLVVELRTRPRAAASALQAFWQQLQAAFPGSCLTESRMLMYKLVLRTPALPAAHPRTSSSARSLADQHESDALEDSACSAAPPAAAEEEAVIQPAPADTQALTASEPSTAPSCGSDSGGAPAGGWQLSDVFRRMELLMQQHAAVLEAYSVSQPSLEEVFVHLVGERAAAPAADEFAAGQL